MGAEMKLMELVDDLRGELIGLCCELVRTNTVNPYSGDLEPGDEGAGQEILTRKVKTLGAFTKTISIPQDIYSTAGILGPVGRDFHGRPNLMAEFKFGDNGKTIILNGHIDTVGVANMTIPPFEAHISQGKIYGRGASDDKGGLTAATIALEALVRSKLPLKGRVILMSVVDEECSGCGAGTIACCLDGDVVADEAIVVDSSYQGIGISSNGVVTAWVKVRGESGHSSRGGVSAIDNAFYLKNGAIDRFKEEREKSGAGPMNLGVFKAGDHPSVMPSQADMGINIFYAPWEAEESESSGLGYNGTLVRRAFEGCIREAEAHHPWLRDNPSEILWEKDALPFAVDEDISLVEGLKSACQLAGHPHGTYRLGAWTDAGNIQRFLDIPVVLFSPAAEGVSHGPCEYISIDSMMSCAKALAIYLYRELRADRT